MEKYAYENQLLGDKNMCSFCNNSINQNEIHGIIIFSKNYKQNKIGEFKY